MEPCIRVAQMSKQYREHLAVDSISFTVSPGEIFGFLGTLFCCSGCAFFSSAHG